VHNMCNKQFHIGRWYIMCARKSCIHGYTLLSLMSVPCQLAEQWRDSESTAKSLDACGLTAIVGGTLGATNNADDTGGTLFCIQNADRSFSDVEIHGNIIITTDKTLTGPTNETFLRPINMGATRYFKS
jgi:hypothetical protein